MIADYRNTIYCKNLDNILQNKNEIKKDILKKSPKTIDMYPYINKKGTDIYKKFALSYNNKCAYCGCSNEVIEDSLFQIDHFLPKSSPDFKNNKKHSGEIENLVFSCMYCNRKKSNFYLQLEFRDLINPDLPKIKQIFYRDEIDYYIKMNLKNPKKEILEYIEKFYNQMNFIGENRRLDYLLMELVGFKKEIKKEKIVSYINRIIEILRCKRRKCYF